MNNTPDIRPAKRAGYTDREEVIAQLRNGYAKGYMDLNELEARLHVATTCVERGELAALVADLDISTRTPMEVQTVQRIACDRRHWNRRPALTAMAILSALWTAFVMVSAADPFVPLHSLMAPALPGAVLWLAGMIATFTFTVSAILTRRRS